MLCVCCIALQHTATQETAVCCKHKGSLSMPTASQLLNPKPKTLNHKPKPETTILNTEP